MQSIEDEKRMEDPTVNTILIFNLQMINKSMNNNCRNEGFGMQRCKDNLSRVLTKVFAQSSDLLPRSANKLIQSTYVLIQSIDELTQSINKWAQLLVEGVQGE